MPNCLIGLGANLGDRRATLQQALAMLARLPRVRVARVSPWLETPSAGGPPDAPRYLNGAAVLETTLTPQALLAALQHLENQLGRRRRQRWGPRTIDLDLLLYDDCVLQTPSLVVPHPRMAWRRFVLEPACRIAPRMIHPLIGWNLSRLLEHLDATPPYVAVTGLPGTQNTPFARRVAEACNAELLSQPAYPHPRRGRFQVDPAGQCLPIALECLRRRARLLAVDARRWSPPRRTVVSDFWFDESRAAALGRPPSQQPSFVFRAWRRLEPRVVRPRLIVWLDAAGQPVQRQWHAALERQLHRADVGPVLRLDDVNAQQSLDEVVAAVRAMT